MSIPGDLRAALDALAGAPSVLVACDFDGVLAPIVDEPSAARALPASAEALAALGALDGVAVALVSGRAMDSLRQVSGPPAGALLVASHGAEGDGAPTDLDPAQRALLARVVDAVRAVVETHPGTSLELKPAGAVLHTRTAARDVAADASRAVEEGPGRWDGVLALRGKEVVELSVVEADKGSALVALRDRLGERTGGRPAVLYAGDDVTDENAFRVLDPAAGDVGIKVGDGDTAAEFRVGTPADVSAVLHHLENVFRV
ncbi:trehalose 6-phosphatase [Quadrisphaera granulorum]|uniref:Trehalose 6-phosphate phosphatase n=1 Tax=Quadrisphaera granulorum TaxID=317664 RepID=A0A316A656_9ACTN|nr:trehalose-phosphatase [Quadrisphaera granulorum]PWJ52718.1 trehalose 6-phosphatase [Quadrisphaera granulorum]SZE97540.1 trehalose 6-phosphatase [Quadrisphaera granulorum]